MVYKIITTIEYGKSLGVNFNKDLRNQIMEEGNVKIYKFPSLLLNMQKELSILYCKNLEYYSY